MRLSIFVKLLCIILPLVCLPTAIVGYLSVQASEERVNRLVRQEQMLTVEAAAATIEDALHACRVDLATISRLPVLEDYHLARSFRLQAETEFNFANIVSFFQEFIARTPFYFQIRYLDASGRELIKVRAGGQQGGDLQDLGDRDYFLKARDLKPGEMYVSPVVSSRERGGYLVHFSSPFLSGWREFAGVVVIDLDFERVIAEVRSISVTRNGYAFLVDEKGRALIHPLYPPYALSLEGYRDPSLIELVNDMIDGGNGWRTYLFQGEEKVAAFAPIPDLHWSLAVAIPSQEFTREARAIRDQVIQVVIVALVITVLATSILAYNLLGPVRRLAAATERLARGEPGGELPVRSRDELGDLTVAFNRMVRNLARTQEELVRSEKLVSLGRLSAGVAHEIRNPLNAIKGAIEFLRRKRADDPLVGEYTQLVSEEIDRLNRFVTEFLTFARQSRPRLRPTDLNRLIRDVQALFSEEASRREVRFHSMLDETIPPLDLDASQLEQVLVNLVVNAMDAMPGGGHLTFSTLRVEEPGEAPVVRVGVEDNGVGIPGDRLGSIFDPFYTTKDDGTGLGLPISLGIVETHGGTLRVESRPGRGAVITIELPCRPAGGEETEASA